MLRSPRPLRRRWRAPSARCRSTPASRRCRHADPTADASCGARIARGGRYYAGRGFRGRGYAPYYGRGFAPYYGYGYAPYYGYGYGGVGAAAGFLGLAAGLALGAAASNSYYGSPYYGGAAGVPAGRLYAPQTGCYVGAGDRVECPRY